MTSSFISFHSSGQATGCLVSFSLVWNLYWSQWSGGWNATSDSEGGKTKWKSRSGPSLYVNMTKESKLLVMDCITDSGHARQPLGALAPLQEKVGMWLPIDVIDWPRADVARSLSSVGSRQSSQKSFWESPGTLESVKSARSLSMYLRRSVSGWKPITIYSRHPRLPVFLYLFAWLLLADKDEVG